MKARLKLFTRNGAELDRQTIELRYPYYGNVTSDDIHEALKAWKLAAGDTIKIEEVE